MADGIRVTNSRGTLLVALADGRDASVALVRTSGGELGVAAFGDLRALTSFSLEARLPLYWSQ